MRKIIAMAACLFLVGCSTPKVEISTRPEPQPKLELPLPAAVKLDDVKWVVITEDNVDQIIAQLKSGKVEVVLFAITPDGYEKLAMNNKKIAVYLKQLQDQLKAYKEYYENGKK